MAITASHHKDNKTLPLLKTEYVKIYIKRIINTKFDIQIDNTTTIKSLLIRWSQPHELNDAVVY